MTDWTRVAKTTDIPIGQGRAVPFDDRMIAVFNEAGVFHAIDDFCPHQGASLAEGYLDEGAVACPWHAWRFSIHNGEWLDNPKVCVESFDVRVEKSDIYVRPKTDPSTDNPPPCKTG
jgi:nitrite reductase (NADH) small subunit/3-phenylpropionate/trans-cinnamate dioxygenase ferredoxin subunit